MNRFRKTKKGRDNNDEVEAMPPPSSFMGLSKSKKSKEVVKPEIDLESALPSADNFRTSLLMPNLSARFSMLREQDDPTTKVGKANDDSVLFPKRQSRLNLFGHNPNMLSDIAEVSSIAGRSSFTTQRVNSYASADDGTDNTDNEYQNQGSIMNRKRLGEGNNLFGGRQKVYKIPVSGSGKDIGGMRGKTVYEDDINLSTFQKLRLKEKEERRTLEALAGEGQDAITPESEDGLPAFMTKRMTSSSTNSGQSNPRTSTAATSIDEQPIGSNNINGPAPSGKINGVLPGSMTGHVSKTRRLYGQGLAQAAQDHQSSALTRLESLSRQRAGAGTPDLPRLNRTFSRSATNLHDGRRGISPTLPTPSSLNNRNYSPVASAGSPFFEALDAVQRPDRTSDNGSAVSPGYGIVPPLSPPISDSEEISGLAAALHPEDRGKATAMGLFNKPSGPYDEQQFMRRQLQMHESRNNSISNSKGEPSGNRPRGLSNTSYRSKAESTTSSYYSGDGTGSRAHSIRDVSPPRPPGSNGTFFLNLDNSDNESQSPSDDPPPLRKVSSVKSQAFDGIHPAFRSRPVSRDSDNVPSVHESFELPDINKGSDLNPIQETDANPPSPILEEASDKALDSPTLGPAGMGLTSMIRTHLRHDSTQSVLPLPSPGLPPKQALTFPTENKNNDNSLAPRQALPIEPPSGPPPPPPTSGFSSVALRAKQLREQASALREQNSQEEEEEPQPQPDQTRGLIQEQTKSGHVRDSSLETQKEREEFANELAERRKRVQESLYRIDSRSNSPAPGRDTPGRDTPDSIGPKPGNGFALLKNRSAKNGNQEGLTISTTSSKALKKLGLGGGWMNTSTPSLDSLRDEESAQGFSGLGKHSNSSSPQVASGRTISSRTAYSRTASNGSQEDNTSESGWSRPASPVTSRQDRSASASARSKSRPRAAREDLDIVTEGSMGSRYNEILRAGRSPIAQSMRPSIDSANERFSTVSSERSSGIGKPNFPMQSEPISPLSDPSHISMLPRPSPAIPAYSANATPPLEADGRDSVSMLLNYSESMTSGRSQSASQRSSGGNGLPKRQVTKSQISEPTLLSSTSNVPMVDLPSGASLSNGPNTPPIPPMNPRRRRTTSTKMDLDAIRAEQVQSPPAVPSGYDDSFDSRPSLRKMPSEGGFSARARQKAMMTAAPPDMPAYHSPTEVQGGMI